MAASYIRSAEDELSCPVCFELFVDPNTPKTLPACGHVCCMVCLKKMAARRYDKKCPECRKIVSIPKDGVTSFQTNFRLRSLADNHRKIGDGQILSAGQTAKPAVCICPVHKGEKMRLYCTTCNVLACQLCMIQKHKGTGHNIDGIEEKYSQQTTELRSFIEEASRDIQLAKDKMQELETQVEHDCQSLAAMEKQIDDSVESYMTKVFEQSKSLQNEAQQVSWKTMADIQQKMAIVEKEIHSAESRHRDATNALENKPNYEYVTRHTLLVDKLKRLRLEGDVSRICTTPYTAARFERDIAQEITLGRIVRDIRGKARNIKSIQTLDGFEWATNTAYSAEGLLLAVCDCAGNKVMIYRKASNGQYEKSHTLNLRSSNPNAPFDVAICSDGRFLVTRNPCIEVYTPEGNYLKNITTTGSTTEDQSSTAYLILSKLYQILGWVNVNVNVYSMATTSNDRILVGDVAGDVARSVITEHDPVGNIVRTIATKNPPYFITLIHDTHIAMSDWESGKVSVMDIQSGQETLSIDIPMVQGICYDEQTDCLLTARSEPHSDPGYVQFNTGVIEQYCCTSGRLVACLTKGLYHPRGMGFLSVEILAVADRKTVKLYKIQ